MERAKILFCHNHKLHIAKCCELTKDKDKLYIDCTYYNVVYVDRFPFKEHRSPTDHPQY